MIAEFFIENIKCNGCMNTIMKELKQQDLVKGAEVDVETGRVELHYDGGDETLGRVKSKLERKGYPEKGKNTLKSTVVSFASCAMGRMNGPVKYQVKNFDVAED